MEHAYVREGAASGGSCGARLVAVSSSAASALSGLCGVAAVLGLWSPRSPAGRTLAWSVDVRHAAAVSSEWFGVRLGLPSASAPAFECDECTPVLQGAQAWVAAALITAGAAASSRWQRPADAFGPRTSLVSCGCAIYAVCLFAAHCLGGCAAAAADDGLELVAGPGLLLAIIFACGQAAAASALLRRPASVQAKLFTGGMRAPLVRPAALQTAGGRPTMATPLRAPRARAAAAPRMAVGGRGGLRGGWGGPATAAARVVDPQQRLEAARLLQRLRPVMSMGPGGEGMTAMMPVGADEPSSPAPSPPVAAAPAGAAATAVAPRPDTISAAEPLHVVVAGAGVGGLALANALVNEPNIKVTVLETTSQFRRFGGPIQLASNAMSVLESIDPGMYKKIEEAATYTGDKINGIKDGIRSEWYAKFDLGTPAAVRGMQYTCVVERPDLQKIMLERVQHCVANSARVVDYKQDAAGVHVQTEDGRTVEADVLVGADGIWSAVRASMRDEPSKGDGSGCSYSGYTVFAGELAYDSFDNGEVGYKVYIGPGQYFVITDIGKGRYQWYAFLARDPKSAETEAKPDGTIPFLKGIFTGWSDEIHHILDATKEEEAEQRDLYDRPPSVYKPWTDGNVTLLGDAVHAMMPNLGQGGCQAIEDAKVISEELGALSSRADISTALEEYRNRRLLRSATVQGLSRFASDIIIKGFDTPCKISFGKDGLKVENLNYAGIVTRVIQPFMPIFFSIQFNFLYSGWRNEPFNLEPIRDLFVIGPGVIAGGFALDSLLGGEAFETVTSLVSQDAVEEAADVASKVVEQISDIL